MSAEAKGKFSAEVAAFARAAGSMERDPRVRNPDYLAPLLLSRGFRRALLPGLRQLAVRTYRWILPGLYAYQQARTREIDRHVLDGLRAGARQLVILGAGLDSRAWRFADKLRGGRAWEVDLPTTGRWKRNRIHRLGQSSDHVTFVTLDFTRDALADALAQHGCDVSQPTIFVWSGVSYYLPPESVESTLRELARFAEGSSLIFDYLFESARRDPASHHGVREFFRRVARVGEPVHFAVERSALGGWLGAHGFCLEDDAGPEEMARAHLVRSDGTMFGRIFGGFGIACASRLPTPLVSGHLSASGNPAPN